MEKAKAEIPQGLELPKDFDEVRPPSRADFGGASSSGVFDEEDDDDIDYDVEDDGEVVFFPLFCCI